MSAKTIIKLNIFNINSMDILISHNFFRLFKEIIISAHMVIEYVGFHSTNTSLPNKKSTNYANVYTIYQDLWQPNIKYTDYGT